ncbi:MAG: peptidoglycan-binding protein LysM [Rhizobiales bacterium]|nr:peptidoglycan-binding protein LysM [Hyphomicrobiales bacterium]
MGLFSFLKDVGAAVGIGSKDEAPDAEALTAEAEKHGLNMAGISISVDGDKVSVTGGDGVSQEEKEKIVLALGNVTGVAAVEESITTTDDASSSEFYTVKKGDTLWAISASTLGNGSKYQNIFEANRPMLSHPDKIYPGQVLRIPSA